MSLEDVQSEHLKDRIDRLVKKASSLKVLDSSVIEKVDSLPSKTPDVQLNILNNLTTSLTSSIDNFLHQDIERFPTDTIQEKVDLLKEIETVSGELRQSTSTTDILFQILQSVNEIKERQNEISSAIMGLKLEFRSLKRSSPPDDDEVSLSSEDEHVIGYALRQKNDPKVTGWASPNEKISNSDMIIGKAVETTENGKRVRRWKKAKK